MTEIDRLENIYNFMLKKFIFDFAQRTAKLDCRAKAYFKFGTPLANTAE